ncbi:hypothetical protein IE53DRAFT_243505 [Violaceomyces palustris]|uniref:Uncharacterized protein n=1 Tax=Violaceomyces palustris TaxID=1673888 RepID=A0ACD0NP22_9BASI|nr:hypothetical protein IE53DRAFT_243505 [Violaceomyces palustris]
MASSDNNLLPREAYLDPNFDPNSLKVPQLRSVLLQHDVVLPSSARKPALIQAFQQHVVPKLESLRSQHANIVASSSGIIDMSGGGLGLAPSSPPPASPPPPPPPQTTTRRKSTASQPRKSTASATPRSRSRTSLAPPPPIHTQADDQRDHQAPPTVTRAPPSSSSSSSSKPKSKSRKSAPAGSLSVENPARSTPYLGRSTSRDVSLSVHERGGNVEEEQLDHLQEEEEKEASRKGEGRDMASSSIDVGESSFSNENPFQSGGESSPSSKISSEKRERRKSKLSQQAATASSPSAGTIRASKSSGNLTSSNATAATKGKRRKSEYTERHIPEPDLVEEEEEEEEGQDLKTSLARSRTMPSLKNYMDPKAMASTPPRVIGQLWQKGKDTLSPSSRKSGPEKRERHASEQEEEEEEESAGSNGEEEDIKPLIGKREARRRGKETSRRYVHQGLSTSEKVWQVIWTAVLMGMVAYAVWFSRESREIGFCDTGSETNPLLLERFRVEEEEKKQRRNEGEGEELALTFFSIVPESIRPGCAPCPRYARCSGGKVVRCASADHVVKASILSQVPVLPSLLPLKMVAPSCVPDTRKLILANEVANEIQRSLGKWRGDMLCGQQALPHPSVRSRMVGKRNSEVGEEIFAVSQGSLRNEFRKAILHHQDEEEEMEGGGEGDHQLLSDKENFDSIWNLAIEDLMLDGVIYSVGRLEEDGGEEGEVEEEEERGGGIEGNGDNLLLVARTPIVPLGCRSRLALKAWLRKTRSSFLALVAVAMASTYLRARYQRNQSEKQRVSQLVQLALERLQEQEYSHAVDPITTPEPFLPTSHLRDHVLRTEESSRTRKRLWNKVSAIVEENSNVRTRQAQSRGEWLRVWEWVGVVGSSMSKL